jgi:hypothetical protein
MARRRHRASCAVGPLRSAQHRSAVQHLPPCPGEELGGPADEQLRRRADQRGEIEWKSPGLRLCCSIGRILPHLIGEAELAELAELIAKPDCRLLTILSPGGWAITPGAGSSGCPVILLRMAQLLSLAPLSSAEYVAPTIAHALGVALSAWRTLNNSSMRLEWSVSSFWTTLSTCARGLPSCLKLAGRRCTFHRHQRTAGCRGEWLFELRGPRYSRRR